MFQVGSSPLARGTLCYYKLHGVLTRLIPARAGNTERYRSPAEGAAAHPRSRGEHFSRFAAYLTNSGSSPLARGTLSEKTLRSPAARLIPARAGNTNRIGVSFSM